VRPAIDELGVVSSHGVTAAADGNAKGILDAVDAFWDALDHLGTAIAMPILSDEHHTLRRLAVECSVHYKPSGAGGGDLGVGFTTDAAAATEMADRAEAYGFQILDLHVDSLGLARSGP
jgi:phosphomevalonate kinase